MPIVWLAFFLSGAAGLSYEVAWIRYLQQLFGAAMPAVSTTVAVFFAGLGLGAAWLGARFDHSRSPTRAYALLEVFIAISACLVPLLFRLAERALAAWSGAPEGAPLLVLVSSLVLLPTTVLLGATFPAMAAVARHLGLARRAEDGGATRAVALFYGTNTLGAVVGSLVASFVLIPRAGQAWTTWIMASANLAAAALLALAGRKPLPAVDSAPATSTEALDPWRALVLAAGTGLLGIAVEVLWTRIIALGFLPSVQVFALVLTGYLTGIALGALLIGELHRRRRARRGTLFLLLVLCAASNVVTLLLLPRISPLVVELLQSGALRSWPGYLLAVGAAVVVALAPSTLLMGATLPAIVGLTRGGEGSTVAGRVYGANVIGGVAGSFLAAFLIMPALGVAPGLLLCAAGYLALGPLVGAGRPSTRLAAAAVALVVATVAFGGHGPDVNPYRGLVGGRVLYYADEAAGSVEVSDDERGFRHLRVNNFHGLSSTEPGTLAMQYGLGHIPLVMHAAPRRALLIGFGTGATLAAMAEHPLQELHAVEILPGVRALAGAFQAANHRVLDDPRVQLFIDDGRRYLARRGLPYDVIVGDLFLPQHPGVGSLYTLEHFRSCRQRLAPSGLLVVWLPLFQLGPRQIASIVQSFLLVFPEGEGWVGCWSARSPVLGLVGSAPPAGARPPSLGERFASTQRASLHRAFAAPPAALLEAASLAPRRLLDAAGLRRLAAGAETNRLERPLVEFEAAPALFDERLQGRPLARQNLQRIGALTPLAGTPWGSALDR